MKSDGKIHTTGDISQAVQQKLKPFETHQDVLQQIIPLKGKAVDFIQ